MWPRFLELVITNTTHPLPVCQIPSLDSFRATRPHFAAVLELCGGALVSLLWTPYALALTVRETDRGEPALASVVAVIEQLLARVESVQIVPASMTMRMLELARSGRVGLPYEHL